MPCTATPPSPPSPGSNCGTTSITAGRAPVIPKKSNTTTSLSHSGAVHVFPIANLDLSLDYDHVRRQLAADQYKRMSLFNASAQYKRKRLVLRLELDNLVNQRHYAYTLFNGINTYTYAYTLCGRTVVLRATFKL